MRLSCLTLVFLAASPALLTAQDVFVLGYGSGTTFEPEPELKVPLDSLIRVAQRQPHDAIAHHALGVALVIKKRPDEAEQAFRRAIAVDSRSAEAWFGLSVVPYCRLRTELRSYGDEAQQAWARARKEGEQARRRALQLDPFVDQRLQWLMLPRLPREVDWQTPKSSVAWLDGVRHTRQGEHEAAYQAFDKAVRLDPQSNKPGQVGFIGLRADAAARAGRLSEAIADYRTLLKAVLDRQTPDSLRAQTDSVVNGLRYRLAVLLQRTRDTDAAVRLFEEVVRHDSSLDLAHVRLANMHEVAGRIDAAIVERQRAVEANRDDVTSLLELGLSLGRAGRVEEARDALLAARRASPDEPRTLLALGQTYFVLGDEGEARIHLTHLLDVIPLRLASLRREAQQLLSELSDTAPATTP